MSVGHSKKRKLARRNEPEEIRAIRSAIKAGRVSRTVMIKGADGKWVSKCAIAQALEELARYRETEKK